jgi:hypothetical protein
MTKRSRRSGIRVKRREPRENDEEDAKADDLELAEEREVLALAGDPSRAWVSSQAIDLVDDDSGMFPDAETAQNWLDSRRD